MSKHICAPPTCSAARATAARSSTVERVSQPDPSLPISLAGVPSKSMRDCLRVWSIVAKDVLVRPSALASTWNKLTPLSVRAATIRISALLPSMTYILVPSKVNSLPDPLACIVIPDSSHFPFSSVRARVAMVPEAICGSNSALASSSPAWRSVFAARTTLEK